MRIFGLGKNHAFRFVKFLTFKLYSENFIKLGGYVENTWLKNGDLIFEKPKLKAKLYICKIEVSSLHLYNWSGTEWKKTLSLRNASILLYRW